MKKRMFEILDQMNISDEKNNTAKVGVCPDVVSIDKKGNNGYVTMGVPEWVALNLMNKEGLRPILLIIDLEEYERIKNNL